MLYEDRFGSVISSSAEDIKHTDNDEERNFSELTVLQFSSDHLSWDFCRLVDRFGVSGAGELSSNEIA